MPAKTKVSEIFSRKCLIISEMLQTNLSLIDSQVVVDSDLR